MLLSIVRRRAVWVILCALFLITTSAYAGKDFVSKAGIRVDGEGVGRRETIHVSSPTGSPNDGDWTNVILESSADLIPLNEAIDEEHKEALPTGLAPIQVSQRLVISQEAGVKLMTLDYKGRIVQYKPNRTRIAEQAHLGDSFTFAWPSGIVSLNVIGAKAYDDEDNEYDLIQDEQGNRTIVPNPDDSLDPYEWAFWYHSFRKVAARDWAEMSPQELIAFVRPVFTYHGKEYSHSQEAPQLASAQGSSSVGPSLGQPAPVLGLVSNQSLNSGSALAPDARLASVESMIRALSPPPLGGRGGLNLLSSPLGSVACHSLPTTPLAGPATVHSTPQSTMRHLELDREDSSSRSHSSILSQLQFDNVRVEKSASAPGHQRAVSLNLSGGKRSKSKAKSAATPSPVALPRPLEGTRSEEAKDNVQEFSEVVHELHHVRFALDGQPLSLMAAPGAASSGPHQSSRRSPQESPQGSPKRTPRRSTLERGSLHSSPEKVRGVSKDSEREPQHSPQNVPTAASTLMRRRAERLASQKGASATSSAVSPAAANSIQTPNQKSEQESEVAKTKACGGCAIQ